ncbi:MAG: GFA family protein [Pseudomonadales bacterium]
MNRKISGGCLCGAVKFTVNDSFDNFYFCHCEQCRKVSGSSHASNLLTKIGNIEWLSGFNKTVRFDHKDGAFTKVFCSVCGSGLPHKSQSGECLVVPAGSLDAEPSLTPQAQIFCSEKAGWFTAGIKAPENSGFESAG